LQALRGQNRQQELQLLLRRGLLQLLGLGVHWRHHHSSVLQGGLQLETCDARPVLLVVLLLLLCTSLLLLFCLLFGLNDEAADLQQQSGEPHEQ
jgi:hypothetical protein